MVSQGALGVTGGWVSFRLAGVLSGSVSGTNLPWDLLPHVGFILPVT